MRKIYNYKNLDELRKKINREMSDNKPIALDLLEELTFMKETMDELKKTVKETGATYVFTQGEQSYLKENPAMKSYNTTVTKYNATLKQLLSLLPQEVEESNAFMDFVANA